VFQLSQGQIINAEITDPHGKNKKCRPVVVLTSTEELARVDEFVVAAISSQFSDPLPPGWIFLPWSADGRAQTGLTKPSVVKCQWIRKIRREQVRSIRGWLPAKMMLEIMRAVTKSA
jgi:mRNA-degrading endonuclease toxin of MazEF toxin-antitoxin module